MASYIVTASDQERFPVGGNVGAEELLAGGVPIPLTPIHRTWVEMGRPIFRGEVTPCKK